MKKKLLSLLLCLAIGFTFAQAPVNNYFSAPNSMYAIVSGTVNQTPTGANAVWNFGTLTQSGTNTDTFAAPTTQQLTDYPGTTQVLTISDGTTNTQAFYKLTGSTLSLTGATNPEFTLDYNTDNALIGTYPLSFGSTSSPDAIAGNIMAEINGSNITAAYTGTITTQVDAHGTLSFNVTGQGTYSGNVTRIQTNQTLNFTVFGFIPGTATVTAYNYYKDVDGALVFRTTEGIVNVGPPANINESFSTAEALITNTLSVNDNELVEQSLTLYPNPTDSVLNIKLEDISTVHSVKIIDVNGRIVFTSEKSTKSINVSALEAGFYLVNINTNKGLVTKKFIKK